MGDENKAIREQTAFETAGIPIYPDREDISATDMVDPIVGGIMENIQEAWTGEDDDRDGARKKQS